MMKGLKKWRLFAMLTALAAFLSACGIDEISTLRPAGPVGKEQLNILILAVCIMTLVVVVVSVIYFVAFLRFRRGKVGENHMPKQVEGSHTLEVIWTVIPIILLLILAVPTLTATYKFADVSAADEVDEAGEKTAVTVNVTAKLYWWEFEYPDYGIITGQELVVPTGEKVYFNVTAADVKHAFWIPSVGGKIDNNVDNINKFYLQFDQQSAELEDGVFYGKCAELCGPSHALMDFKVKSLDRPAFDAWVASMKATEGNLADANSSDAGEAAFAQSCLGCHAVSAVAGAGIGPNLTTFGDRNRTAGFMEHTEEAVVEWIMDGTETDSKLKPGNLMTGKYNVSEAEAQAIAEYLMTLKVED
jgi:cytochrome c oxidase subunit II